MPGHITGLFRIFDGHDNPLHCGSTGAGFSVAIGTLTKIETTDHSPQEIATKYNGKIIDARVTEAVIQRLTEEYGRSLKVGVDHESQLPIGAGFGASGAGALGAAIALGHLLDPSLDVFRAASFAHYAEVSNHTGLGDVIAQTVGGPEIRTYPGAPGVGKTASYTYDDSLRVVLAGSSGLETREVLTNPQTRERINIAGDRLLSELIAEPTFDKFIRCAREFSTSVGLETQRVATCLSELDTEGFQSSSMVMLGDSVFCFCEASDTKTVGSILTNHWNESEIMVTEISREGGRLMT